MKPLADYLAKYLDYEYDFGKEDASCFIDSYPDGSINLDVYRLEIVLKQAIDAYESTENCTIGICGGDCPECKIPMELGQAMLYNGEDEIEVCKYECPECGYIVYG